MKRVSAVSYDNDSRIYREKDRKTSKMRRIQRQGKKSRQYAD